MAKENFRYLCQICDAEFNSDVKTNECYWCKSKIGLILSDYTNPDLIYEPYLIMDMSPKTVGTYAEKNKKVSKDKILEDKIKEQERKDILTEEKFGVKPLKKSGKRPFWRNDDKPLDLSKIKNVKKYIQTGDSN